MQKSCASYGPRFARVFTPEGIAGAFRERHEFRLEDKRYRDRHTRRPYSLYDKEEEEERELQFVTTS